MSLLLLVSVFLSTFLALLQDWGTVVASPLPRGIGDPVLCGSQPLVTPFPYVDLETRSFAVFLCFFVCILVKIDTK